jgi:hypothetical protein
MAATSLISSDITVLSARLRDIGDLVLRVGLDAKSTPAKSFLASSHAMCLASKVWHAMLHPHGYFRENKQHDIF